MNYHNDKWIMEKLNEHYCDVLKIYPKERIVGIFVQGSQNYGLDYINSDIDTKCVILPTLEDICLNNRAESYTYVRENNEHIDFKDLRVITGDFKKQNINFLEILFTKYFIINKDYEELFSPLRENAETIARYDNYRFIKSVAGMSMEKYKALTLDRPSQHEEIVKYGYATKQWHHIDRLNLFIKRWDRGESFANCLIDPRGEMLTYIKQYGHCNTTLTQAKAICKTLDNETNSIKDKYISTHERIINKEVEELINSVVFKIIKKKLRKDSEKP